MTLQYNCIHWQIMPLLYNLSFSSSSRTEALMLLPNAWDGKVPEVTL